MGNGRQLKPGQIQLMSAGRGITHSEFNPSPRESLHFLQIWIQPRERGLTPSYTEEAHDGQVGAELADREFRVWFELPVDPASPAG